METPLIVVSGLPRSGTSLMMAALEAGGLPLLYDQSRAADVHNPNGYFEDPRVLDLERDASWLVSAKGRGVKILSHLLPFIPSTCPAKVLLMRRPLPQVMASQDVMLGQSSAPPGMASLVAKDLARTLAWLQEQPHLEFVEVAYPELVAQPLAQFTRVQQFLDRSLDVSAMVNTVDPLLHHQR